MHWTPCMSRWHHLRLPPFFSVPLSTGTYFLTPINYEINSELLGVNYILLTSGFQLYTCQEEGRRGWLTQNHMELSHLVSNYVCRQEGRREEEEERKRTYRFRRWAWCRRGRRRRMRSMTRVIEVRLCSDTSMMLQNLFSTHITTVNRWRGKGIGREPEGGALGLDGKQDQGNQNHRDQYAQQHQPPSPISMEAWKRRRRRRWIHGDGGAWSTLCRKRSIQCRSSVPLSGKRQWQEGRHTGEPSQVAWVGLGWAAASRTRGERVRDESCAFLSRSSPTWSPRIHSHADWRPRDLLVSAAMQAVTILWVSPILLLSSFLDTWLFVGGRGGPTSGSNSILLMKPQCDWWCD